MVIDLAKQAGLSEDSLYFNVETVGNASSASIPLAIHDAVRDGVIKEPMRIFAPGFGAGAVAGYAVIRIDPAVVAISTDVTAGNGTSPQTSGQRPPEPSPDDAQLAFG
jgi:3-oxoacyl-[acyl-carrier-protein] synthase-3